MFKPSARNSETLRQGELLGDGGIEIPGAWSAEHVLDVMLDGNGPKSENLILAGRDVGLLTSVLAKENAQIFADCRCSSIPKSSRTLASAWATSFCPQTPGHFPRFRQALSLQELAFGNAAIPVSELLEPACVFLEKNMIPRRT